MLASRWGGIGAQVELTEWSRRCRSDPKVARHGEGQRELTKLSREGAVVTRTRRETGRKLWGDRAVGGP